MAPRPTLAFSRPDLAAQSDHRTASDLAAIAGLAGLQAEFGGRIDALAGLNRRLARDPAEEAIDLGEYLRDLSTAVVAALSGDRDNRLHFTCGGRCVLPPERALPIGLIVVELVTNAVRYAHPTGVPGDINVTCTQGADGTMTVEVSDDGVGLPEGLDPLKADSLGLRLVRSLAEQLGARAEFTHDALGLSCVLQIPGELRV